MTEGRGLGVLGSAETTDERWLVAQDVVLEQPVMQCAETEAETVAERNCERDYYQNSTTNRQQSTIWCTSDVGDSREKEENSRNGSRPQFQDLSKSVGEVAQWDTSETIPVELPTNQRCGQRSQYVY